MARSKRSVFTDALQITHTDVPPHLRGRHYLRGTSAHSCPGTAQSSSRADIWDARGCESPLHAGAHLRPYAPSQLRGCGPQITSVSPHPSGSLRSQWLGQLHFLFSFQRGISLRGPLKEL